MRELALVRDEVVRALREAGLTAFAAWPPERMRDHGGAVAAVDVGSAESGAMGFCNYLGQAYRRGRLVTADYLPGDLVFLRFSGSGRPQHIGIVETAGRNALVTIEGNTGAGSDANGGQVQRRERPYRHVLGAYRPAYEEEHMTQQQFDTMMEAWLERRAEQEPGGFSAEARAWAEETGLILGDAAGRKQYKSFCTREQLMTFLYRLTRMK